MMRSASDSHSAVSAPGRAGRDRLETAGDGEPAVRPGPVLQFPDAGVGLLPPLPDGGGGGLGRFPVLGVEPVAPSGDRVQLQRFAEDVELELGLDLVADDVESTGVAGQVEVALAAGRARRLSCMPATSWSPCSSSRSVTNLTLWSSRWSSPIAAAAMPAKQRSRIQT